MRDDVETRIQLERPTREPPPVLLKVRVPGRVAEKLERYRALYGEHYGEEIRIEALAAEIIGQFLAREPALRRHARERRTDGNPGQTPSTKRMQQP